MPEDIGSIAKGFMPSMGSVYTVVLWILGILVFAILTATTVWIFIDKRRYSRIIPIYENRNGVLYKIGEDKARVITIDKGLAKIWYLKKLKVPVQAMVYSAGRNIFPVIKKADGDLINFELKISEDGRQVIGKVMPTSIRMANANLRRYFRESYKKEGFMEKYGKTIMYIVEMVIVFFVLVYILMEVSKIIPALGAVADKLSEALAKVTCTPTNLGVAK